MRYYKISDIGEIQLRMLANLPIDTSNDTLVWIKEVIHEVVYSEITQEKEQVGVIKNDCD